MPTIRHRTLLLGLLVATLSNALASPIRASVIVVETADPKISGIGPCSLQEAIYASNLRASLTIDATDPDHFVPSNCAAGTGDDIIALPAGALFPLTTFLDGDAYNPYGPTATPIIFSTLKIEGNGATIEWTGNRNVRLFAVGPVTIEGTPNGTVSGTGSLTLHNLYIKGFHAKGGDGADGGGGGLGAGGAVYVQSGSLTVENCTFDANGAQGGSSVCVKCSGNPGGGGGGLGGNGGAHYYGAGSGGGGARGTGGESTGNGGGGGGGIVYSGAANNGGSGGPGGYLCGGSGGSDGNDGNSGKCPGGGGGGGGKGSDAGSGAYGGGGGGACDETGGISNDGGNGGFGGGGGGSCNGSSNGGDGGFGGGGGTGDHSTLLGGRPGKGGGLGGDADSSTGGGGGAAGGAIFNDGGTLVVRNSTFTNNYASRGVGANNGGDAGAAIFSRNGSTTVVDCTVAANQGTGAGAGIVVWEDGASTSFTLNDTIVAQNGAQECFLHGAVSASGIGNLIMANGSGGSFGSCPGVVASDDPKLFPLQPNGGKTPTMGIPLSSAALAHADAATSLGTDQRGATRPQRGGYDIGAYQLCRDKLGALPCDFGLIDPTVVPAALSVDEGGSLTSDNDGVLEPGESVPVQPSWRNLLDTSVVEAGTASGLTGPLGATYVLADGSADYGTIDSGATGKCVDCYTVSVSKPAARPVTHWDLRVTEIPSYADSAKVWKLHVGESFTDVPRSQPFYKKIETLLHAGITAGCGETTYCPGDTVSRGQMALFLARSLSRNSGGIPSVGFVNGHLYRCEAGGISLFADVSPEDPTCKSVHYIASRNVTSGCATDLFCPDLLVSRSQMAIFLAKAIVAPAGGAGIPDPYGPDPGTGFSYSCSAATPNLHFSDVRTSDSFCKHVHYLWAKGIIGGCSATAYCPAVDVYRDAMAKFLSNAFNFRLYAP